MSEVDTHRTCQHPGCVEVGSYCSRSQCDDAPDEWYCDRHAVERGFCLACGLLNPDGGYYCQECWRRAG